MQPEAGRADLVDRREFQLTADVHRWLDTLECGVGLNVHALSAFSCWFSHLHVFTSHLSSSAAICSVFRAAWLPHSASHS